MGGSPCSGKSTVAEQLSTMYGWRRYCVDDHFDAHGLRLGANGPTFEKVLCLPIGDRLSQPISTQVRDVCSLAEEEFGCMEFQRQHYAQRSWAWELVADLADPSYAFERWMRRDVAYARLVQEQADSLGCRVLIIDGSETVEEITARVAEHFA